VTVKEVPLAKYPFELAGETEREPFTVELTVSKSETARLAV